MSTIKNKPYLTSSGIEVKPYYVDNPSAETPGNYPYTRGIHPDMYRGKVWTMRQYAGFGSAIETNKRYRYLLEQGVTGLSVAFDLPTQMGRDSDSKYAKGEVGKVGVAISSIEDMRTLFDGIPLEKVSVSMTINSTAAILLAFYLVIAEERGVSWDKLQGTIQNDILKEYIARGTYIYPPSNAISLITDIFEFCKDNVVNWNTISISGYHIREAGSTAVQELAFTFSNAIAYIEAALNKGLAIDDFAPRLAFFFNCHLNFLEEIAKFRAARRIWAKIMKERFKATDERSLKLRFHTQTAGSTLTAQQPLNNIIRTTMQALASVLGGTQSLHTNGYDEALGLPTAESASIALRTQQIIALESGIVASADPLGGSYLIEEFTDKIEDLTFKLINQIDQMGGMVSAIEAGFPQNEIENSAFQWQKQVETKDALVVGVNIYNETGNEKNVEVLKINQKIEDDQIDRLTKFKSKRNQELLRNSLANLSSVVTNSKNCMPAILDCVRTGATVGEISDVLRDHWGEYR
jgi:methylmalonyl-CoA mutase N-terminal domain/subunit